MNRFVHIFFSLVLILAACQNDTVRSYKYKSVRLRSHIDTVSYSLGVNIGKRLRQEGFDQINLKAMTYAIAQVLSQVPDDSLEIHPQVAQQILKLYLYTERKQPPKVTETQWEIFLRKNALRKGVRVLPSGLQYEIIKPGDGPRPKLTDYVTVSYKGYLPNGTIFDNNYERSPATFQVSKAIEGWRQALVRMRKGAIWRIYLPPSLAFGSKQVGKVPPNSVVIYEIHLLDIKSVK